ncbi:UDP-glucose--hexose-1-phosphate uridylyltransferase [Clostridiaceae bacterium UIB06]|uniref:Galactose-1-phosphate uridylyltransferase n=1 Tax=Clostridium thailandense TaxID=2794346 RepID=A0A949U3T4_9CLOT|nr:UDP-glucose--hexose-1-phosphate uridylyltransferase [Clostridium thailandense]MBV7276970.1 UDP-glucose--hexose-1-phosphate uridylyltransferase [Clostridium thailandense]MCH5137403.1 UDP-glucose--hexose-1-phosphate uridylyltransferase [Clostridiaceae bacterium UIB06]
MEINISYEIERLLQYGLSKKLIDDVDLVYTRNRILEVLRIDDVEVAVAKEELLESPDSILSNILGWCLEKGVLEEDGVVYKDLLDTKIMGCLIPRPSEVISKFNELYLEDKKKATDYYYDLSRYSNYIRTERIKKDLSWKIATEYGYIDITINLSKPEKDPKAIAAARNMANSSYPKCLLCKENEGYAGRINHPARQNHRVIPVTLNNEKWFFQYSPYVYYNEHCIVFKGEHKPMKISKETFMRLLDFTQKFPHYFIGSNADLPIVGGSILSHDHFQGGNYEFAMAKAKVEKEFNIDGFSDVKVGRVKWPMSVIRLEGENKESLIEAAYHVYIKWQDYSDETVDVLSNTDGVLHNTITPIARMRDEKFQLDLVLRNNRTTEEHPEGIFHPHRELHHIKKENIGLIEVMGLAVLPARLKTELKDLEHYLISKENIHDEEELSKHKEWCEEIIKQYENINSENVRKILQKEVGIKFTRVLEHAGVFKRDEEGLYAFDRFISSL